MAVGLMLEMIVELVLEVVAGYGYRVTGYGKEVWAIAFKELLILEGYLCIWEVCWVYRWLIANGKDF